MIFKVLGYIQVPFHVKFLNHELYEELLFYWN